eukprot:TRINITY_DN1112_c0_g1_i1.p1 TRINITY_DN1112_c0_g1~~TRINITY_DN1112_c0_g1_i1.p1  ORF type:complete len:235 (+),score=45.23 TRINITY_DN1112_c0_g1_i1:67-771(+)
MSSLGSLSSLSRIQIGLLPYPLKASGLWKVREATKMVKERLFIKLLSEFPVEEYDPEQLMKLFCDLYSTSLRTNLDVETDVLLPTSQPPIVTDVTEFISPLEETDEEVLLKTNVPVTKHSITCIGGTFDRLHPGHKLLITKAVLHTTEKLVVGITNDGPLLAKKSYLSELQRLETREAKLRQFLSIFCPFLEIQIIPIDDIFGPTITMSELDALVVSSETHSGAMLCFSLGFFG